MWVKMYGACVKKARMAKALFLWRQMGRECLMVEGEGKAGCWLKINDTQHPERTNRCDHRTVQPENAERVVGSWANEFQTSQPDLQVCALAEFSDGPELLNGRLKGVVESLFKNVVTLGRYHGFPESELTLSKPWWSKWGAQLSIWQHPCECSAGVLPFLVFTSWVPASKGQGK